MKKTVFAIASLLSILTCLQASDRIQKGLTQILPIQITQPASSLQIDNGFGKIPLQFIPNQGQVDEKVAFYVQGRDKTIYFTSEGLTFVLRAKNKELDKELPGPSGGANYASQRWVVKLDFLGSGLDAGPTGLEENVGVVSYFKGKPEEWRAGIQTYSKIIYRELWPGIDLVYFGTLNRMKYEFIVHPGADPSKIRLAYRGADSVILTPEGRLKVDTPAGKFEDDAPLAYQDSSGTAIAIPVTFDLISVVDKKNSVETLEQNVQELIFGFRVGEYDHSKTLVLDPVVLVYCGFIGGADSEFAYAIDVDSLNNVYVTGYTYSNEITFPQRAGPDATFNGNGDAFVAKLNSSGTELIYCGFIGGLGSDSGKAIAVDNLGNAYVTGDTASTEISFPVIVGPDLTSNGEVDAFVAKVNASGAELDYCGFIGGSDVDGGSGISIDGIGNVFLVGNTRSPESSFPVLSGPDLTYNGLGDVFVAQVDSSGEYLRYCGYVGGSENDIVRKIDIDTLGNAYIIGSTDSNEATFPVKVGPDLIYNGNKDAFVAKVNSAGMELVYCGYIGSNNDRDYGNGIAVDASGNAYIVGHTYAPAADFPRQIGPDLTPNGAHDAFICKLNASGTAFAYCGFIGGSGDDIGYGVEVDDWGNAYISGYTSSTEATFPVVDGPDLTYNGGTRDIFIAKVLNSGGSLVYCTYVGGSDSEICYDLAIDNSGGVYVTGGTSSTELSFPVVGGPDLTFNGGEDVFVAKIQDITGIPPILTSLVPSCASAGDPRFTLTVFGSSFYEGAVVRWDGADRPTTYVDSTEVYATIEAEDIAVVKTVQVTVRNAGGGISDPLEFTVNNPLPSLTSLVPSSALTGGPSFILSVIGSHLLNGAVVRWDGNDRPTTFVSNFEIRATIGADDLAMAKTVQITVRNPDGAISDGLEFLVNNPIPILTGLVPSKVSGGGTAFDLELLGSGFITNSVVKWNGVDKVTTFVSGTELRSTISAGDIATAKEVQISVFNPSPGGGASNIIVFPISGFTMDSSPSSVTVTSGQTAAYAIQVVPNISSFDSLVNLTCTGLPRNATATMTPGSVTPGMDAAAVALSISTRANASASTAASLGIGGAIPPALVLLIGVLVSMGCHCTAARKRYLRWVMAIAFICALGLISSCGATGDNPPPSNGTPPGTYQITVQGQSGTMTASTTITLVVR